METENVALVHYAENGDVSFSSTPSVGLYVVDERAPHDRVYRVGREITLAEMLAILADSPIGSSEDARHAALMARISEALDGTPRLTLADPEG